MIRHNGPQIRLVEVIAAARAKDPNALVVVVPAGESKASAMTNFALAFSFPAWFGHNLDALEDALKTAMAQATRPVALIWDGVGELAEVDPDAVEGIEAVLHAVESEAPRLTVTVLDRL